MVSGTTGALVSDRPVFEVAGLALAFYGDHFIFHARHLYGTQDGGVTYFDVQRAGLSAD